MATKFTPEQTKAIKLHNRNILVSAAAGSGKTAVLSERIVQMVCREENPVDIDRLLIVTFTNAAAAEMRERISRAILERLNEDGANEHLQRQAALLHNAQITTIDSFCLFVLRNNFQDIGLDPAFRVADEGELALLKQEVLGTLLEERFAEGNEDFLHCVEYYCPNGKEKVLEDYLLNLYHYALSYPFPEEWLLERKKDYLFSSEEEIEKTDWGRYLLAHLKRMAEGLYQDMKKVQRLCEQPDGPYMYGELCEKEAEQLFKLTELNSLSEFSQKLNTVTFDRLPSKKDDSVSPEKREAAKSLREEVKNTVKSLCAGYFSMPMETVIRQSAVCSRALCALVDLCLAFKERLDEKKREKKLLDFSDMEHFALQILIEKDENGQIVPTRTAQEYRDYFKEILIDEYQDSNLVQEYLLKAVSGEEDGNYNRFMVGDVKQSIYKFRLARPELFLEKYKTYQAEDEKQCRIDLHKNFRSRREVLETVNTVFSKIMTESLGGIAYDDAAALYEGAVYPENTGCESELILFEKPEKDAELNVKQAEAYGIAAKIKELKRSFQVTDKETGALRPVQYKDMVILLRTGSGWDEEFKAVFAKEGIPAYVEGKTGYFATKEIQDILQFLRVLDNPGQDIPLFGVLKSVFGGFSDEEAARIRSHGEDRKKSLYACMKEYDEEEALSVKCRHFIETITRYREYCKYRSILELLKLLTEEFHYMAYVSALPAGGKRLANVEMLLTKAAAFEKNSYYGLFHFIRYIEQLEKYQVDFGEANTLDENADVVRIMSIHKSKGLEFPVAIVAGLSKRFNMQDTSKALLVDMDMGVGTDYINTDMRVRNKTLRGNVLAAKIKLDNLAEELRVLYVAMTRAREKLIMTGMADKKTVAFVENRKEGEALSEELSYTHLVGAASFLDYVLPVFPDICVKSAEDFIMEEFEEDVSREGRRLQLLQAADFLEVQASAELAERFAYEYPHKNLEKLYTKTTVSELKKAALSEQREERELFPAKELFPVKEVTPYIPSFMREKEEISGTTRGSAMHRVMELLDFTEEEWTAEKLQTSIDSFVKEGRLTKEYAAAVRTDKILCFLKQPIAKRMGQAARKGKLFREQPFVYGIDAARLSDGNVNFPKEETVLIQGIVDVYFEEGDDIILLDYKTDVIQKPEELSKRYRVQLDYYEEALMSLTGKKIREKRLYSFYLGCEVPV